jgi:hypothetical protein
MIVCGKCGNQNQLGRVFCGSCGAKLDTNAVTSHAVTEMVKQNFIQKYWKIMVISLVAVILILVGLSFWPKSGPIGDAGKPAGIQRTKALLDAARMAKAGTKVGPVFKEAELNAYLAVKAKEWGVKSISVDLKPHDMHVRMIKPLFGSVKLFGMIIEPTISYDVHFGSSQQYVFPRSASKGHLPMMNKRGIAGKITSLVASQKEWEGLRKTTDVKIEEGQITLTITGQ